MTRETFYMQEKNERFVGDMIGAHVFIYRHHRTRKNGGGTDCRKCSDFLIPDRNLLIEFLKIIYHFYYFFNFPINILRYLVDDMTGLDI